MNPVSLEVNQDTPALRKERGAFFTPESITSYIAEWAIRSATDKVLEPSAGDAAFLTTAVKRMKSLSEDLSFRPTVHGVEIHEPSARMAENRVREAGGDTAIRNSDFFAVPPDPTYDIVIGNPPFIRYQDFSGEARARSRDAAHRGGVALSGLASSWAAFTIHSAMFLKKGGRLGLVLPAELLSVNYASPVRQFLFKNFKKLQLVFFGEQIFPGAEADVILLMAEGYGEGAAEYATILQAKNGAALTSLNSGLQWRPADPSGKWTSSTLRADVTGPLHRLLKTSSFTQLENWGRTTLGIVTGNNKYFTLSPQRAKELGLDRRELLRLSPPGSAHLRGLELSRKLLTSLGRLGQPIYLFYPKTIPSHAAKSYIRSGQNAGIHSTYKCRARKIWYRVPIIQPADLLLTCMNADTPRLTSNSANAYHLNSVHGVYINSELRHLACELLPLASLNSITLLHAEIVGRTYGGGLLKIEPREADAWAMPSPELVQKRSAQLLNIKSRVGELLKLGRLLDAVEMVDNVIFDEIETISTNDIKHIRQARTELAERRTVRGASGR